MLHKVCPGTDDQPAHSIALTEFTDDKNRSDGKAAFCKYCCRVIQREWKRNNQDKIRAARQAYKLKMKLKNGS